LRGAAAVGERSREELLLLGRGAELLLLKERGAERSCCC
jgi:hypothetical protein